MTALRQRMPRAKNEAHLAFIRSLPCVCCLNDIETEAAHLRMTCLAYGKRYTGKQEKPDDIWTLPLCGTCHRKQHTGSETAFWEDQGINPFILALSLFAASGDRETALIVIGETRKRGQ